MVETLSCAVGKCDSNCFWEVAFVSVPTRHGKGPKDPRLFEFGRERVGLVVGCVCSFGEVVGASDDDGGVGGNKEIGAEMCVAASDDDWVEFSRLCPVD